MSISFIDVADFALIDAAVEVVVDGLALRFCFFRLLVFFIAIFFVYVPDDGVQDLSIQIAVFRFVAVDVVECVFDSCSVRQVRGAGAGADGLFDDVGNAVEQFLSAHLVGLGEQMFLELLALHFLVLVDGRGFHVVVVVGGLEVHFVFFFVYFFVEVFDAEAFFLGFLVDGAQEELVEFFVGLLEFFRGGAGVVVEAGFLVNDVVDGFRGEFAEVVELLVLFFEDWVFLDVVVHVFGVFQLRF